ncbi:hypothetical protein [Limosilactobacillus secaliphilus]|uniref:Lipoprotein n=1 Tax=Limosilactobacillus secaliphilus TaxID=396268 RepID=A0A0R2I1C2_9LACO|nr:hypothetical protein [Limosilactobacillus secaliphilus]KRN58975.1 hypothetical protein IV45_GL000007 [Limosilactobacillus secaliphilus]
MKKLTTITLTIVAALSLAACGNNSQQSKENSSLKAENSSLKAKSSSKAASESSQKAQTASSSAANTSSQSSQLTVEQVADRFAQLQHLDRSQINIYVHPTADPDVFRVYVKDKNSDPSIDSLIDHHLFNVRTNQITQATSRE